MTTGVFETVAEAPKRVVLYALESPSREVDDGEILLVDESSKVQSSLDGEYGGVFSDCVQSMIALSGLWKLVIILA